MTPLFLVLALGARVTAWLRDSKAPAHAEHTVAAQVIQHPSSHRTSQIVPIVAPDEAPWHATLWLTGVDYFSSLGYAPGLAFLAAGYVSPVATLLLVLVTFGAAVPVFAFVAKHSPQGEGSIKLTERLTSRWGRLGWLGKSVVLVLLGFAMTDFVLTITLSAADATHHVLSNPLFQGRLGIGPVAFTAAMILALCLVFLKGFKEAISLAVAIGVPYMVMNVAIIVAGIQELQARPDVLAAWLAKVQNFQVSDLIAQVKGIDPHGIGPLQGLDGSAGVYALAAVSLLVFPKLALGMSGFETGVSVMAHIRAKDQAERIRNTRKLLIVAATIMSVCLIGSAFVTTTLIPAAEFGPKGQASGRALAYLAHDLLGPTFGTAYDFATVAILWFAGASAMAGLLNILPRYLPRFGMSPTWIEYRRPLVLVLTGICLIVNWVFKADVEAQGGAYATGVLVLMTMSAFAVMLAESASPFRKWSFRLMFGVFCYVLAVNSAERPDGFKIAGLFILAVVVASVWSRWRRASELRVAGIRFEDRQSEKAWNQLKQAEYLVLIPLRSPTVETRKKSEARRIHHHSGRNVKYAFLHVNLTDDPSLFSSPVRVTVKEPDGDVVIEVSDAVAVANAIAYVALELSADEVVIGLLDSGTPVVNAFLYLLFGTGEVGYSVRAIFVRIREERLADQFAARRRFDAERDRLERDLLRDAVLLEPEERKQRVAEMFQEELAKFEKSVAACEKLPRLILFD
jgi:hypothetical protein